MQQNRASWSCTALSGTNKTGQLKPNSDGYYTVVLGALNVFNSAGAYYPRVSAEHLFEESSSFQRRIASGSLRGECGHPRRQPGQSMQDFMGRIMDIYEPNVSHHMRRVYLDSDSVTDASGKPVTAILGEVRPAGPMGPSLESALQNPNENVCFSIRSITNDEYQGGVRQKHLRSIVTFDWVNEPGIAVATKWKTPTLESLDELIFSRESLTELATRQSNGGAVSLEHAGGVSAQRIIADLGWDTDTGAPTAPSWAKRW